MNGKLTMTLATAVAALAADAAELKTVGNWKVSFDEKNARLTLENAVRQVTVDGTVGFASRGAAWTVVASRDAAVDRLSLVNPGNTVLGYVSFRGEGDRLSAEVLHRAGANFFPGILTYDATARVREISFACRTIPARGEKVLNFADGAGDTTLNDSVFAREEDLAVRFFSEQTSVASLGKGAYAVKLAADIDDPAKATITVEADGAYYKSRWAPGYTPIDRRRCPKAPTGWMSWNVYFDKAGSLENLAEARVAAKYLKPFGLDIWSIESWQDNSEWLPVSSFHHHENRCFAKQFPEGMKHLADEIRKIGFRPGIWMSLYGEGDDAFYRAHKGLYIHDKDGRPINNWAGKYMLDTTNPEALALMTKLARQAREEWGYEFFKFDGMANTPRKFERPDIRACAKNPGDVKWFENSVRALRAGIGPDALFLACMGDFTGTEVQFVDASRLGSDVVGCYGTAENCIYPGAEPRAVAQMPVKWQNVLHQAECTFTQVFVNNLMFYTDPDTLLVNYSLEQNEAEVMATVIALPGQLMFMGDRLAQLRADRMKILQQVLPVADVHPQNLYPYAASVMIPVWNLTVTRPFETWHVVALFNFENGPKAFDVPVGSLGLDPAKTYVGYEFWRQQDFGEIAGSVKAEVPMRTVRLLSVREKLDRPQFVGDDRHVTMGSVELNDVAWNAAAKTLAVDVRAVGTFPLAFAVRVPEGYAFRDATAPDGVKVAAKAEKGLVRITVTAPETRNVKVSVRF